MAEREEKEQEEEEHVLVVVLARRLADELQRAEQRLQHERQRAPPYLRSLNKKSDDERGEGESFRRGAGAQS